MKYRNNITGERFNLLTVLKYSHTEKGHGSYWVCLCDCGNETITRIDGLKSGRSKSCGCLQSRWTSSGEANRIHGESKSRLYKCWQGMKARCFNVNHKNYKDYGGRGITVCERWLEFEKFAEDMGGIPTYKHSIERINNNGNYEPGNCKWIRKDRQNRNKRNSLMLSYQGEVKCLKEWSEYFNINYSTLHKRVRYSGRNYIDIFKELQHRASSQMQDDET